MTGSKRWVVFGIVSLCLGFCLVGCGPKGAAVHSGTENEAKAEPANTSVSADKAATKPGETEKKKVVIKDTSATSHQGARVSTSAGAADTVVVLWPRIIPKSENPDVEKVAAAMHQKMQDAVRVAAPTMKIDPRPAPERVCPKAGCQGPSIGALLANHEGSCVAVAFVAKPGPSQANLITWAGGVSLKATTAPFRDPIESHVTITDYIPCNDLLSKLDDVSALEEALKQAVAP